MPSVATSVERLKIFLHLRNIFFFSSFNNNFFKGNQLFSIVIFSENCLPAYKPTPIFGEAEFGEKLSAYTGVYTVILFVILLAPVQKK